MHDQTEGSLLDKPRGEVRHNPVSEILLDQRDKHNKG
jgi:hypothetical protein